jgi:hypothetical protein
VRETGRESKLERERKREKVKGFRVDGRETRKGEVRDNWRRRDQRERIRGRREGGDGGRRGLVKEEGDVREKEEGQGRDN